MIKISVISNNTGWQKYIKNPNRYIEKKIEVFNKKNKTYKKNLIFCTLLLSGNNEIKKLNKKFRNKNRSTDILSFPFYDKADLKKKLKKDKEVYLGDIIINFNKIKKRDITNFKIEFNKLLIHGLVHLFGHDHIKNKDYIKMYKIEKKFLSYIS